jgi:quercetin dioxygenase-like cupin family protein
MRHIVRWRAAGLGCEHRRWLGSRIWPVAVVVVVLLGSAVLPTVPPAASAQATGIEEALLAKRAMEDVPPGRRWVLRRGHPVNEDAHGHAGGFVYAASGDSFLVVDETQSNSMREGQAIWAPEGIGHLHASTFRASNSARSAGSSSVDVWTILLERETEARRPGAAATSPLLLGLIPGRYEARLVATTFQPGAATALRRRSGPELAYTLDGFWELEYAGQTFPLGASQGYLADPGVTHRLRNIGSTPGRLLSALLVPAGRPAEEPVP